MRRLLDRRMLRTLALLSLSVLSIPATAAERTSTKCQRVNVEVGATTDFRLIGCGENFPDNVLWHLDRLDSSDGSLDATLARAVTGRGALVYVADTGIRSDHDEFVRSTGSNVIAGLDPASDAGLVPPSCTTTDYVLDPCFTDSNLELFIVTHGTAVGSMVAGRHTGVAPDAQLVAVRVLTTRGSSIPAWTHALDAIVSHAFDPRTPPFRTAIVNISGHLPFADRGAYAAFEAKMLAMIGGVDRDGNPDPDGKRFLFAAAAGNLGLPEGGRLGQCDEEGKVQQYPAVIARDVPGLLSVGGMNRDNRLWVASCIGDGVEILAPAADLLVASISGRDHYRGIRPDGGNSGTSYATPYVSGVAALLLELNPDLTPAELEARIKSSSSFVNEADDTGQGRVAVMPAPPPRRRATRK
jgi:subtilisin family serine protease